MSVEKEVFFPDASFKSFYLERSCERQDRHNLTGHGYIKVGLPNKFYLLNLLYQSINQSMFAK